ncbi:hypothetical protein ACT29H_12985 [Thermophagus sp. OGC60D27]|uniref:hypothetical protein n=1 Tax=Thermophagus sp. OGC60D27 TaxID=3458415 RepID=UPI004037AD60
MARTLLLILLFFCGLQSKAQKNGARFISTHGYDNCIELVNKDTRVVLEPNAGGRVLLYEYKNENVLQINPDQNGWTQKDGPVPGKHLCAGRFDLGPQVVKPNTDLFFSGPWEGKITGELSAVLTSQQNPSNGLKITRKFNLNPESSELTITQTLHNNGNDSIRISHWSRTFGKGNGICFMSVQLPSRFPQKYIQYGPPGKTMEYLPNEPMVKYKDGYLLILGPPARPKFVMDVSEEGWIGYLTTNNRVFFKKFKVYPGKMYGEITAANASIWYNGKEMVEIEPISPWEWVLPGKTSSFTETWILGEYDFPENRKNFEIKDIKKLVKMHIK